MTGTEIDSFAGFYFNNKLLAFMVFSKAPVNFPVWHSFNANDANI
jgi:hypothetical protein